MEVGSNNWYSWLTRKMVTYYFWRFWIHSNELFEFSCIKVGVLQILLTFLSPILIKFRFFVCICPSILTIQKSHLHMHILQETNVQKLGYPILYLEPFQCTVWKYLEPEVITEFCGFQSSIPRGAQKSLLWLILSIDTMPINILLTARIGYGETGYKFLRY